MKYLFIDDERFPPDDGKNWTIVRSSDEAKSYILNHGFPDFISWDHDLGGEDTSVVFLNWLIDYCLDCDEAMEAFCKIGHYVHSQNPVGVKRIWGIIEGFNKFAAWINTTVKNTV